VLASLAFNHAENQRRIAAGGGVRSIVSAMQRFAAHLPLQVSVILLTVTPDPKPCL